MSQELENERADAGWDSQTPLSPFAIGADDFGLLILIVVGKSSPSFIAKLRAVERAS